MNIERQIRIERRVKKGIDQELQNINNQEINELNFCNLTSGVFSPVKNFENMNEDINMGYKKVSKFLNKKPIYINSTGAYWVIDNTLYRLSNYWGGFNSRWGGIRLNGDGPSAGGCRWFLKGHIRELYGPHYKRKKTGCSLGMITFDELTKQTKKNSLFDYKVHSYIINMTSCNGLYVKQKERRYSDEYINSLHYFEIRKRLNYLVAKNIKVNEKLFETYFNGKSKGHICAL